MPAVQKTQLFILREFCQNWQNSAEEEQNVNSDVIINGRIPQALLAEFRRNTAEKDRINHMKHNQ